MKPVIASFVSDSLTNSFSATVKVEASPVVPKMTTPSDPSLLCHSKSSRKVFSSTFDQGGGGSPWRSEEQRGGGFGARVVI